MLQSRFPMMSVASNVSDAENEDDDDWFELIDDGRVTKDVSLVNNSVMNSEDCGVTAEEQSHIADA
jgi:hypothetical protein